MPNAIRALHEVRASRRRCLAVDIKIDIETIRWISDSVVAQKVSCQRGAQFSRVRATVPILTQYGSLLVLNIDTVKLDHNKPNDRKSTSVACANMKRSIVKLVAKIPVNIAPRANA